MIWPLYRLVRDPTLISKKKKTFQFSSLAVLPCDITFVTAVAETEHFCPKQRRKCKNPNLTQEWCWIEYRFQTVIKLALRGNFTLVLPWFLSLSLFALASSISCFFLFAAVYSFHTYSTHSTVGDIVTGENNASSCYGCAIADALPLCHNSTLIF